MRAWTRIFEVSVEREEVIRKMRKIKWSVWYFMWRVKKAKEFRQTLRLWLECKCIVATSEYREYRHRGYTRNIGTEDIHGGWSTQLGTCWIWSAYLTSEEHTQWRNGYILQNEISHSWEREWNEMGNSPLWKQAE